MGQRIKSFADGSFLEYDRGSFDGWCVYLVRRDGTRKPPRDVDYFYQLKRLAGKYGAGRIYRDFVCVYDLTGKRAERSALDQISRIAAFYGGDARKVDLTFSILYMAMISEEQKAYTKLGKRVKRLGVHRLLMEGRGVEESANFMRGMPWREIAKLCQARGF